MFYLTMHSTHFIYSYMVSVIWLRTILIVKKETRCRHIGYSYGLTARILLYAPSHRQDNTYHSLCYTSRGALAGTRNSSMGRPQGKTDHDSPELQCDGLRISKVWAELGKVRLVVWGALSHTVVRPKRKVHLFNHDLSLQVH